MKRIIILSILIISVSLGFLHRPVIETENNRNEFENESYTVLSADFIEYTDVTTDTKEIVVNLSLGIDEDRSCAAFHKTYPLYAVEPMQGCLQYISLQDKDDYEYETEMLSERYDAVQFLYNTDEETNCIESDVYTEEITELRDETIETENDTDTSETQYPTSFARDSEEVKILAQCLKGEAGDARSDMQKAAVVWCVLNRVDNEHPYYPDDIISVVTQQYQFTGWNEDQPVIDELVDIVMDVLGRWEAERRGKVNVGRVLPVEYLWFYGQTSTNYFRDSYETTENTNIWDWSLPNPYET